MTRSAGLVAALLLCVFALAPLGYPGYIQPQAGFRPVYWFYAWERGGLDATWAPPDGDGLLPYALAEGFRLLGMSGPDALKAVFGLSVLLTALGAYLLLSRSLSPPAALGLALVWTYAPMSLAAVYARGLPGAALALGLLPWLALAPRWASAPGQFLGGRRGAAIALAALAALSSPGFAVVGLLTLLLVRIPAEESPRRHWFATALALVATCLLVLVVRPPTRAPFLQFALPYQLLSSRVGYGASSLPWAVEAPAPLSLGVLPLAIALGGLLFPHSPRSRRWLPFLLALVFLVALALPIAEPVWTRMGLSTLLAGPWQLLAIACFLLTWLAAELIGPRLAAQPSLAVALGLLALILAVPALDPPLTPLQPAARPLASFDGGRILLLGAELHGPLRHGATLRLRLYWQAREPLPRDYTVFVHVLDAGGRKWGQRDSWPGAGQLPTSGWRPGRVVVDDHAVYVDLDGPRQGYRLVIGLYDLETGERLPLGTGGTELELVGG